MDLEIREFFTEEYEKNWYLSSRADILSTIIRPLCGTGRGRCLVDVGAGIGSVLVKVGHEPAIAIEGDLPLARVGHARDGLRFVVADLGDGIPLSDGSADVALALDVIEHLEDDHEALREIFRILRPSGVLVVSVPAFQSLWSRHDDLHHHKRRYSRGALLKALAATGFSCQRVTYFNTLLFPLVYASRKLEPFFPVAAGAKTDYEKPPRWLARALGGVFGLEARIIPYCNLPVGVSLLAIATKP